jgi:hypothetical protein
MELNSHLPIYAINLGLSVLPASEIVDASIKLFKSTKSMTGVTFGRIHRPLSKKQSHF